MESTTINPIGKAWDSKFASQHAKSRATLRGLRCRTRASVTPVNTTAPAITGTAAVGNTLTCSNGVWSPAASIYSFQWYRGASAIGNGHANQYTLVGADHGASVTCQVRAANPHGPSQWVASNAVSVP